MQFVSRIDRLTLQKFETLFQLLNFPFQGPQFTPTRHQPESVSFWAKDKRTIHVDNLAVKGNEANVLRTFLSQPQSIPQCLDEPGSAQKLSRQLLKSGMRLHHLIRPADHTLQAIQVKSMQSRHPKMSELNNADSPFQRQLASDQLIDQLSVFDDQMLGHVAQCRIHNIGMLNIDLNQIGNQPHHPAERTLPFSLRFTECLLDPGIESFEFFFQLFNHGGTLLETVVVTLLLSNFLGQRFMTFTKPVSRLSRLGQLRVPSLHFIL